MDVTPGRSLPTGGRSREEVAKVEVGHTRVPPGLARALVLLFLGAIAAVLLFEVVSARGQAAGLTAWSRLFQLPAQVSAAFAAEPFGAGWRAWNQTVAANRTALASIAAFENALDDESAIGRTLRPRAQLLLTRWLGAGNERVYIGHDGWLFFRTDVDYVTGAPFLDPRVLRRRVVTASEWAAAPAADPRPAILDFHRQLAARGIVLIVMPTPVKPTVHPEKLDPRLAARRGAVENPSFDAFVQDLRTAGVHVFDLSGTLAAARRPAAPQYLETDTHWRPETTELAAERLAGYIREHVTLEPVDPPGYRVAEQEVTNVGDTVVMLDLPEGQSAYAPETVWIRRVLMADGTPWRPSPQADVLVLGDSFSNIYSLATLGWGDSAGLIEHLGLALGRPVDRLVQNDEGAHATRGMLLRAGRHRLAPKRIVVWQFAARELAFGDWRPVGVP